MPITNSVHLGRRGNMDEYEFTDHTARVFKERWRLKAGLLPADFIPIRVPQLESELARKEIEEAIARAEAGDNPDKVPPDHQTQAEFDRRVISALMQNTSIETSIAALPFWTAHQARSGNNNVQRAATLGVPTAKPIHASAWRRVSRGVSIRGRRKHGLTHRRGPGTDGRYLRRRLAHRRQQQRHQLGQCLFIHKQRRCRA
jgi:hypothetical protein